MDVLIVGGGRLRGDILASLERRGHTGRVASRSTGFDLTRQRLLDAVEPADAIIQAPGIATTKAAAAIGFFSDASRQCAEAATAWGARHVLLSIVNCSEPENQSYGYYAGKAAEKAAALRANPECRVVASTQWHVFAQQMLERLSWGPLAVVPSMRMQPVDPTAVADALAAYAVGEIDDAGVDLAGPEELSLLTMVRAVKPRGMLAVPLAIPGVMVAFRSGALVPRPGTAEIVGRSFDAWLNR